MAKQLTIAGRPIGPEQPPYIIAEMSANHLGSFDRAVAIMKAAAAAGADAVKLQTYTPDGITMRSERPEFHISTGPWAGWTLHDLYAEAQTPWSWHPELFALGRELGVTVFSSPFDTSAVDRLAGLDAPAYKIASFELVDHQLIRAAAATGKPVIMSTGMASPEEIREALDIASAGAGGCAVLHCISGYPASPSEFNLRRLPRLAAETGAIVGISDHSPGSTVAVAAVALGAHIIEKHVTLRRADGGPDAAFSLEPEELKVLVDSARTAWTALGNGEVARARGEKTSTQFRRSLYVVEDVAPGQALSEANVRSIRPNRGLAPKFLGQVVGRKASRAIERGTPLSWDLVE